MGRRVTLRRALLAALVLGAAIQLVPVERTNPPVVFDVDAAPDVASVLHRACYDCHSNETRWPWYSHVAPASWFVARHVKEGREALNFSEWPALDFEGQDFAFGDIREQVGERHMPLRSYTIIHRNARLSEEDRRLLLEWAGGPSDE